MYDLIHKTAVYKKQIFNKDIRVKSWTIEVIKVGSVTLSVESTNDLYTQSH